MRMCVCVGGGWVGGDTEHAHGENDSESINQVMVIEVQTNSIWETSLSWYTTLRKITAHKLKNLRLYPRNGA
jgi:hypothetical protein